MMRDAWLLLLLLLGGRRPGRPAAGPAQPAAAPPRPPTLAKLYQLPGDSYDTVHLATKPPGEPWREVGVFSSEARAVELAIGPNRWQRVPGVVRFESREAALR